MNTSTKLLRTIRAEMHLLPLPQRIQVWLFVLKLRLRRWSLERTMRKIEKTLSRSKS